jgi:glycine cleavage system transcriptional repressor
MKRWFALSAIGRDRPGIVADLADLIYECDCNLEDSSMTILGSEFAVLLLLTGEGHGLESHGLEGPDVEARLSAACKRVEWEKRLTVFFRPLDGEPVPYGVSHHARGFELQAVGVDRAGIVARTARCLAKHAVSITHMSTASRPEPGTGTPIYHMQIRMEVPQGVDESALRRELDAVAAALNIDLTLQKCGLEGQG